MCTPLPCDGYRRSWNFDYITNSAYCLSIASASAIGEPATSLSVSNSVQTVVSTLASEQLVGSNNPTSATQSLLSDAAQSAPSPSNTGASSSTSPAPASALGATTTQMDESNGMCMILIEADAGGRSSESTETGAFASDQMWTVALA